MTSSSPSTTTTVCSSTSQHSSTASALYKGKIAHRSWQQLPAEIVRLIATQYLLDVSSGNYCPQIWELRENWHSRIVYTILRDANDLEKLMRICPTWHAALEAHLFWQQACTVIDPYDALAHHVIIRPNPAASTVPSLPFRITSYRHFRNITNCSCYVCRINSPHHSAGLAIAKRPVPTPFLGTILVCRDHRKNSFCGLCLREAPPLESENDYNLVSCVENEDDETWPGVETTCRICRSEWLWRRVSSNPRDRDALGGPKWNSPDWETRQSVEAFIEMGEGTISDVITLAQEKHWLRNHTKLPDMLSQALAASRYATREEGLNGRGGYSSEEELSEDDVEDEDDPELMSLTEDAGGVRELAISDWARNRILDGHWFSPADQWYGNSVLNRSTVVRAVHPCPWSRDATCLGTAGGGHDTEIDAEGEEVHPKLATVRADVPPTFQLCEQAYVAFQKQMRMILLPAMSNIVRRVIIECQADSMDPAMRATRMDTENVVSDLRDEAVWYNGIDWLERRANGRREVLARRRREEARKDKDDGDDSSTSSKSDGSHTTSPVLSTSTLQTTPSPPPSVGKKDDELGALGGAGRAVTIPVSPVLESPVLLHPIPYVPVTASHLPHYSMESLKMVWREACAPLYHCRCKICERAMANANGSHVPKQAEDRSHNPVPPRTPDKPVEIRIDEVTLTDLEGEEEIDVEEEEESGEESDILFDKLNTATKLLKRGLEELDVVRSLKRGSEQELDRDSQRSGTPPKRPRVGEKVGLRPIPSSSPERLKKRSSEELDDDVDGETLNKRIKVRTELDGESSDGVLSPPTSVNGTESVPSAGDLEEPEDDHELQITSVHRAHQPRLHTYISHPRSLQSHVHSPNSAPPAVRQVDLDQLYAFEAEVDI